MKAFIFALVLNSGAVMALTNEEATALVAKSIANTEVMSSRHYCIENTMTCRSMYQLRDKTTKKAVDVFYDTFYSADRQVGSTCYFIPTGKNSGKYHVLSDLNFDGKVEINLVGPSQASLVLSHDRKNVFYYGLKMPKLGTTQYLDGKMIETEDAVYVEGKIRDTKDPSVEQNVRIDYQRVL